MGSNQAGRRPVRTRRSPRATPTAWYRRASRRAHRREVGPLRSAARRLRRALARTAAEARRGTPGPQRRPVTVDPGAPPVAGDEGIRPDTDGGQLAGLRPAFRDDGVAERFPQIDWRVTAGNSSPINDGAVGRADHVERDRGPARPAPARPAARFAVVGADPLLMLTASSRPPRRCCARRACGSTTSTPSRSTRPSPASSWPGRRRPAPTSPRSTCTAARSPSATRSARRAPG